MSMDEFHDFVVDVGLETKDYKFDVMCNQFVKANAVNTAQVRQQRQLQKRDADALHDERKKNVGGKFTGKRRSGPLTRAVMAQYIARTHKTYYTKHTHTIHHTHNT